MEIWKFGKNKIGNLENGKKWKIYKFLKEYKFHFYLGYNGNEPMLINY